MNKNLYPDYLLEHSFSLEALGINDFAFDKNRVMNVIEWCRNNKRIILGGDVYKFDNITIEPLSDSWYFEPADLNGSCEASCNKAAGYIKDYVNRNEGNYIFSLVVHHI